MDFVVADLFGQYDAVRRYTHGWSREQVLGWLCQFGHVERADYELLGTIYRYRSACGLETLFSFDPAGGISIPDYVHHFRADESRSHW